MRTTVDTEHVNEFLELLATMGRKNSLRDPFALLIAESDLGPAQVHALLWLLRDGPLGMGELAQRTGVNQKTITGVVDRLEREGYAKRQRPAEDRRVVRVVLAPKGQKLAEKLAASLFQNVKSLLELLDDRDRTDLFRIISNIAATLSAASAAVSRNASSR
jgi:DNA-binding MarR family transcriptional regulator